MDLKEKRSFINSKKRIWYRSRYYNSRKNAIQSPPDSPDITNLTMTKGDKPVEQNIAHSIPESPDLTNVTMTRGDDTIDKLNTTRISKFGKYEYIAWINHHRKYNSASLNDKDKPELKNSRICLGIPL